MLYPFNRTKQPVFDTTLGHRTLILSGPGIADRPVITVISAAYGVAADSPGDFRIDCKGYPDRIPDPGAGIYLPGWQQCPKIDTRISRININSMEIPCQHIIRTITKIIHPDRPFTDQRRKAQGNRGEIRGLSADTIVFRVGGDGGYILPLTCTRIIMKNLQACLPFRTQAGIIIINTDLHRTGKFGSGRYIEICS